MRLAKTNQKPNQNLAGAPRRQCAQWAAEFCLSKSSHNHVKTQRHGPWAFFHNTEHSWMTSAKDMVLELHSPVEALNTRGMCGTSGLRDLFSDRLGSSVLTSVSHRGRANRFIA